MSFDRRGSAVELGAYFAIASVGIRFEREDRERGEDRFELRGQLREPFFTAPKRSSQAAMLLVQTLSSPCSRLTAWLNDVARRLLGDQDSRVVDAHRIAEPGPAVCVVALALCETAGLGWAPPELTARESEVLRGAAVARPTATSPRSSA